jgi:hypothetical protein
MPEKDENQQVGLKYNIWNTNTKEVDLEPDLINRTKIFKKSLDRLGKASKMDDGI